MRDPNRIDDVLGEVRRIWRIYPDMRLGQLICNLTDWAGEPAWEIEDETLLKEITRHCDGLKPPVSP